MQEVSQPADQTESSKGPDLSGSLRANRSPHVKMRLAVFSVGVLAYGLAGLLSRMPALVESLYAAKVAPLGVWFVSRLTGLIPFSLTEVCYVAYASWILVDIVRGAREVSRRKRSVANLAACAGTRILRDVGIIVTVFYVAWGFNYSRPSLEARVGWPEWTPGNVDELRNLAGQLVEAGNHAYLAIHDTADAGEPTELPEGLRGVHRALEPSWERAAAVLDLPGSVRRHYGRPKFLLSSPIYARLGITGFYFPFTAEANLRWGLPAVSLPQSAAHEKAHQRGIGPEAEASFVGFVVGVLSDDPYVRYSSIMFAERQLMAALARADRESWRNLASRRLPGVRRDLEDLTAYFRQFVGVGTTVGRSVNNQFLRANRVEGGVLNYGRAARLLITFSREHDGAIVPDLP